MAWERHDVQRNADDILQIAGELHARLGRLGNSLDAMGKGLAKAVRSFNDGVGAYQSRVMVSAARLAELGAGAGAKPRPPAAVVVEARPVSVPSAAGGDGDDRGPVPGPGVVGGDDGGPAPGSVGGAAREARPASVRASAVGAGDGGRGTGVVG